VEVLRSPLQGTVLRVEVEPGTTVQPGQVLFVIESMKMEYTVEAERGGVLTELRAVPGETVAAGDALAVLTEARPPLRGAEGAGGAGLQTAAPASRGSEGAAPVRAREELSEAPSEALAGGPGAGPARGAEPSAETESLAEPSAEPLRPELLEVLERHRLGLDEARPEAVERRRRAGRRTARENLADLCDPGSFVEYGPLAIAAQRRRRSVEELIRRTPADGLVAGIGTVDGHPTVVMSYDYTVLAGTQGVQNHRKKDRLFELAARERLPVVLFAEGGGGRPGDTDGVGISGLDCLAFRLFAELSGLVPLVGIVSGYCFAGNAALLGCCDVVIATQGSSIGMGGPAMIEGGGLGTVSPDEVGPVDVQVANGVVDVLVADEAEAVAVAKRYLAYFRPPPPEGRTAASPGTVGGAGGTAEVASTSRTGVAEVRCADQRLLRDVVPRNRRQAYDVHRVVELLADTGSVLELRAAFGRGMVTALARIEGRPLGIVANNPMHLAGAIDAEGADKAARFLQLCDAFDLPVLFLCDTPGIMVGPDAERTALVRHVSRLFVVGASLSVPFVTVVLRKGYGLGAQAMAGGSFRSPLATLSWPTGEFGGMGLEGAVRLGYRRELEEAEDPEALFEELLGRLYEQGRAVNAATYFEFDDVIDPADTRRIVAALFAASPPPPPRRARKKRPCIDTW
jgi:acetyl-CoA carboxylase carboxyltransferase component